MTVGIPGQSRQIQPLVIAPRMEVFMLQLALAAMRITLKSDARRPEPAEMPGFLTEEIQ
jgi:hypothetical protein